MVLALIASACGGAPTPEATEESAMPEATGRVESSGNSGFVVDPLWPMALPNDWMFGNVVGVAVDSQDNVWVAHRPRSQNGSEGTPAVLAFDQDGNVVKSWGGKDSIPEWGTQEHGLYIDYRDNVWVGFGGGLPYEPDKIHTYGNALENQIRQSWCDAAGKGGGVPGTGASQACKDTYISRSYGTEEDPMAGQAQALGDLQVLAARGRRALRVHLGGDVAGGLSRLADMVRAAVS